MHTHAVLPPPPRFHENLTQNPRTIKRLLLFLLLPFALGSCDNDDESRTEIWTIAPEKGVAGITQGFGYVPAYIVRKGENSTWEATAARIEGFTFERGGCGRRSPAYPSPFAEQPFPTDDLHCGCSPTGAGWQTREYAT